MHDPRRTLAGCSVNMAVHKTVDELIGERRTSRKQACFVRLVVLSNGDTTTPDDQHAIIRPSRARVGLQGTCTYQCSLTQKRLAHRYRRARQMGPPLEGCRGVDWLF